MTAATWMFVGAIAAAVVAHGCDSRIQRVGPYLRRRRDLTLDAAFAVLAFISMSLLLGGILACAT